MIDRTSSMFETMVAIEMMEMIVKESDILPCDATTVTECTDAGSDADTGTGLVADIGTDAEVQWIPLIPYDTNFPTHA